MRLRWDSVTASRGRPCRPRGSRSFNSGARRSEATPLTVEEGWRLTTAKIARSHGGCQETLACARRCLVRGGARRLRRRRRLDPRAPRPKRPAPKAPSKRVARPTRRAAPEASRRAAARTVRAAALRAARAAAQAATAPPAARAAARAAAALRRFRRRRLPLLRRTDQARPSGAGRGQPVGRLPRPRRRQQHPGIRRGTGRRRTRRSDGADRGSLPGALQRRLERSLRHLPLGQQRQADRTARRKKPAS